MEIPVRMDSFDRGIFSDELGVIVDSKSSINPFYDSTRWSVYGGIWGINGGQGAIIDVDKDSPALVAMGWASPISAVQARLSRPMTNAGVAFPGGQQAVAAHSAGGQRQGGGGGPHTEELVERVWGHARDGSFRG